MVIVKVVVLPVTTPIDDCVTEKLPLVPVEIIRVVPTGFPLLANVTDADVVNIWKLVIVGVTASVDVDVAMRVVCVLPSTDLAPA